MQHPEIIRESSPKWSLRSPSSIGIATLTGLTLLLFIRGWGCWTLTVCGDNSLDVSDALRFYHGDLPYRDFIPFYGGTALLTHFLVLVLSRGLVPGLWIFYGILSLMVTLWLFRFWKRRTNFLVGMAAGLLFLTVSAYSPFNNTNWPMPYSHSGVLGPALIMALLSLAFDLKKTTLHRGSVLIMGLICGALPTIKTDYAGVSLAAGLLLTLRIWKTQPRGLPILLTGFCLPSIILHVLFSWFYGASFTQIWVDPLKEAVLLSDNANTYQYTLRYLVCITAIGSMDILGRLGIRSAARLRLATAFLFAILPLLDLGETLAGRREPPFQFIFLKYGVIAMCYWAMVREGILWLASMIRKRQALPPPLLFLISTVAAASIFRAFVIGFYTVPYVFPILLLVAILQTMRWVPRGLIRFGWTFCFSSSALLVAIASLFIHPPLNAGRPKEIVHSRFGTFPIFPTGNDIHDRERTILIQMMSQQPLGTPILAGPWAELYVVGGQKAFGVHEAIYKLCILKNRSALRQQQLVDELELKKCGLVILDSTEFKDGFGDLFGPESCSVLYEYLDREFSRDPRFRMYHVYWRKSSEQKIFGKEHL